MQKLAAPPWLESSCKRKQQEQEMCVRRGLIPEIHRKFEAC